MNKLQIKNLNMYKINIKHQYYMTTNHNKNLKIIFIFCIIVNNKNYDLVLFGVAILTHTYFTNKSNQKLHHTDISTNV